MCDIHEEYMNITHNATEVVIPCTINSHTVY